MDQPKVSESQPEPAGDDARRFSLIYLTSAQAESSTAESYVVIVRTREEFERWLLHPEPGAMLLQVEGLLMDPQAWAIAA